MRIGNIDLEEVIHVEKDRGARRIELTNLDLLIMVWLDKFGYVNADSFVTEELSYDRFIKRLKKLYDYGYVDRYRFNIYYKYDYRLKMKGMRFVQDYYYAAEYGITEPLERAVARYNERMSEHQNLCARIGWLLLMEGIDSKEIVSDRDLKMYKNDVLRYKRHKKQPVFKSFRNNYPSIERATNSDLLIARDRLTYIAVEIERTYKGQQRTKEKLRKYDSAWCVSCLWLIDEHQRTLKQLIEKGWRYATDATENLITDINTPADDVIAKIKEMLNKQYEKDKEAIKIETLNKYFAKKQELKEKALDEESLKRLGIRSPYHEEYLADNYPVIITEKYIIPFLKRQNDDLRRFRQEMEEIPAFSLKKADREKYSIERKSLEYNIRQTKGRIDEILESKTYEYLPESEKKKILECIGDAE